MKRLRELLQPAVAPCFLFACWLAKPEFDSSPKHLPSDLGMKPQGSERKPTKVGCNPH